MKAHLVGLIGATCIAVGSASAQSESSKLNELQPTLAAPPLPEIGSTPKNASDYVNVAMDEKYGFRSIKFGTPVSSIKGLKFVRKVDNTSVYTRTPEVYTLGNARLSEILYTFYGGRLDAVVLVASPDNAEPLLDVLRAAYGNPISDGEIGQRIYWSGQKMTAFYTVDDETGEASVLIKSLLMENQRKADQAARTQKAANEL